MFNVSLKVLVHQPCQVCAAYLGQKMRRLFRGTFERG